MVREWSKIIRKWSKTVRKWSKMVILHTCGLSARGAKDSRIKRKRATILPISIVQSFFCVLFFSLCSNLSIWPVRQVVPDESRCYIPIFDGLVSVTFQHCYSKSRPLCCLPDPILSSFKMSRMTLQLLRSMARMISAWRGRTKAKYPGSGVPTLPVGGSARRFICRISHVWCLVVLAHLLCTFSVGHFHICAREGIYETVTDSSTLPPTWSAKFLAGLGKWTWKGNPQKKGEDLMSKEKKQHHVQKIWPCSCKEP